MDKCRPAGSGHFDGLKMADLDYQTKPIIKLGRGFDESTPYMKFGSNLVVNDQVRVSLKRMDSQLSQKLQV